MMTSAVWFQLATGSSTTFRTLRIMCVHAHVGRVHRDSIESWRVSELEMLQTRIFMTHRGHIASARSGGRVADAPAAVPVPITS